MTDFPPPLTPPDCDLRGNDWMPLHGGKLFGSRFYSLARRNPRAGLAGLKLWWESWQQCPTGSLPDDDFDLADLAGFGEDLKAWKAAKSVALHGFIKCSDGRLYHPVIAQEALKSFALRLKADKKRAKDLERLQAWRAARKAEHDQAAAGNCAETQDETRFETPVETDVKCVASGGDKTGQDKEVAAREEQPSAGSKTHAICRSDPPQRWAALAEEFQPDDRDIAGLNRPVVRGEFLDLLADRVLDAGGINDAHWRGDFRPIVAWLEAGRDAEMIIGAIRQVAARPGYQPPRSLKYFDNAIREYHPA